ncbi:MAG: hypothetical protein JWO40_689 [Candidatus Doudnabacteria bacterium]|nr:hypothetical protein [Candidatus Doudnabacteria bacterium]
MNFTPASLVLIIASFLLVTVVGIGMYQSIVVMPTWFANPPVSFGKINQNGTMEKNFWIALQVATVLVMVTALVLNWNNPERRMLILLAGICYIVTAILSGAYLAPKIIEWGKAGTFVPSSTEIITGTRLWLIFSWIREVVLLVGGFSLLVALVV